MKFRLLLAGLLIAASASSALASGPYIGTTAGVSMFHDADIEIQSGYPYYDTDEAKISYDSGVALGGSFGYDFDGFRLEGEVGYRTADLDTITGTVYGYTDLYGYAGPYGYTESVPGADVSITSYMMNGIVDFAPNNVFSPFLGAGLGILRGEMNQEGYASADDTVVGYQMMAGFSIKAGEKVFFDVSYRFQGAASDFETDDATLSYTSSNILGGIRLKF